VRIKNRVRRIRVRADKQAPPYDTQGGATTCGTLRYGVTSDLLKMGSGELLVLGGVGWDGEDGREQAGYY